MTRSQTAIRHGLDNTPGKEETENLRALCGLLEQIRALAGRPVAISSGYRSPEVNAKVGGKGKSQHTSGEAADFDIIGLTTEQAYQLVKKSGLPFDQLIQEFGAWVHVSFSRNRKPRGQCLRAVKRGRETVYIAD